MKKLFILMLCLFSGEIARAGNTHSGLPGESAEAPVLTDTELLMRLSHVIEVNDPNGVNDVLTSMDAQKRIGLLIDRKLPDHGTAKKLLRPALHQAVCLCSDEIVEMLLHCGANVNRVLKNGNILLSSPFPTTPLLLATMREKFSTAKILLQHGADPKCDCCYSFYYAIKGGCSGDILKMFLQAGANIWKLSSLCYSALHCAAEFNNEDAVHVLLSFISDAAVKHKFINAQSTYGTALHLAVGNGNCRIMAKLLDEGANINALDRDNRTPLQCAQGYHRADAVELLMRRGANP